jgi:hypothetical protein
MMADEIKKNKIKQSPSKATSVMETEDGCCCLCNMIFYIRVRNECARNEKEHPQ